MMTVTMAASEEAGMIHPEARHRVQPDLYASIILSERIILQLEKPLCTLCGRYIWLILLFWGLFFYSSEQVAQVLGLFAIKRAIQKWSFTKNKKV